jgi:hypothetical protein
MGVVDDPIEECIVNAAVPKVLVPVAHGELLVTTVTRLP